MKTNELKHLVQQNDAEATELEQELEHMRGDYTQKRSLAEEELSWLHVTTERYYN